MGVNSKIQWTHHTFNPWRGCSKVSEGCANCYADAQAKRNPGTLGVWGPNGSRVVASEAMWREPLKWDRAAAEAGERHRVFCASMADVFEDWAGPMTNAAGDDLFNNRKDGWDVGYSDKNGHRLKLTMTDVRRRLFALIAATPNLDWLLLTKRPENAAEFVRKATDTIDGVCVGGHFPTDFSNAWLGVSVENQEQADKRLPHLFKTPAAVRFLSCEPLLGPVDLRNWLEIDRMFGSTEWVRSGFKPEIDWVIVGGESGHGARPMDVAWARSIVEQCQSAGVACFVKQLGARPIMSYTGPEWKIIDWPRLTSYATAKDHVALQLRDKKGGDMAEWPADLMIRELPKLRV